MADKISDKKEQEIERLIRQLDHKEHELEEKYCDVGKSIMDKLEKENQEIGHMVDEVIQLKRKLIKAKGQIRCPAYCSRCGKKLEKKKNDEQQWQGCEEMEETACMK